MPDEPQDDLPNGPSALSALTRLSERVEVSAELRILHEEVLGRLRKEATDAPGFGTLQDILLERTATQLVMAKHKEETAIEDQRVIKELNALLISYIGEIYKQNRFNSDLAGIRELVHEQVLETLDSALEDLDVGQRRAVKLRLAESLERVG